MATELEVMQDAIKIGLPVLGTVFGATIGALGSYFVSKLQQRKQLEQHVYSRRMEILESVAEEFSKLDDWVARHVEEAKVAYYHKYRNEELPEWVEHNLNQIAAAYHNCQPELKKVEARLHLLGMSEAARALIDYVNKVNSLREFLDIENSLRTDGEITKKFIELSVKSEHFYKVVSEYYNSGVTRP